MSTARELEGAIPWNLPRSRRELHKRPWGQPSQTPKKSSRLLSIDPDLDPAVKAILDLAASGRVWDEFTPAVRAWLYRPPLNASIRTVRENLNLHGLDLFVGPLADHEAG
jgi:hypothetical protein